MFHRWLLFIPTGAIMNNDHWNSESKSISMFRPLFLLMTVPYCCSCFTIKASQWFASIKLLMWRSSNRKCLSYLNIIFLLNVPANAYSTSVVLKTIIITKTPVWNYWLWVKSLQGTNKDKPFVKGKKILMFHWREISFESVFFYANLTAQEENLLCWCQGTKPKPAASEPQMKRCLAWLGKTD